MLQHIRIRGMAPFQRNRLPLLCLGRWRLRQGVDLALMRQLQISLFVTDPFDPRIQAHAVSVCAAEIAAVLIGPRVQTQMIFAGSVVTAEGAACLNFLTVKRSVIEDKPAPSGGFQDRQLLIGQTARPLSEK